VTETSTSDANGTGGTDVRRPAGRGPAGPTGAGGRPPAGPVEPVGNPALTPVHWWLERRRRKRRDPNPGAKGRPYRSPPLWQRVFSIIALGLISIVFGLILAAVVVVLVAAVALVVQSAIGS
jgi:hypothetical protein